MKPDHFANFRNRRYDCTHRFSFFLFLPTIAMLSES